MATPSPTPIIAREKSSTGMPMLAAMGVITVAMLHHTTPNPSTFFPPILSASSPPPTCVAAAVRLSIK